MPWVVFVLFHGKQLTIFVSRSFLPLKPSALYFVVSPPSRLFNNEDFLLDAHRYHSLAERFGILPSAEEVAKGMGENLARIHCKAGYDARDAEFVRSGDVGSGFTFFVIDFVQVRRWTKTEELVQTFFCERSLLLSSPSV